VLGHVAKIDELLDHYCDREVAEVLNRQGWRTWQDESFNLKKIAHIRQAFNLKCRYSRLRAKGLLTTKEMSVRHGVAATTINLWAREGRLQKHRYDNARRCLYEPLEKDAILKGHGGRRESRRLHFGWCCRARKQCGFDTRIIPAFRQRPGYTCRFGSFQV
jgi:hypothetical protein